MLISYHPACLSCAEVISSKEAGVMARNPIQLQHVPRYLAECEYRFNRRYDLKAMIPRFLTVAARTPPMPYRLLKLADQRG